MFELNDPYSRDELVAAFGDVHNEVAELFRSVPREGFFQRPAEEVWSPAENLIHLIRSVKAVASGMRYPRLLLVVLFGAARKSSRRCGEMVEVYQGQLARGARAGGRYVPPSFEPADAEDAGRSRQRALVGWERTGGVLVAALERWNESALDRYLMPHPLLGKLTVREMLFFTLYHDLHHAEIVRKQLEE